MDDERVLRKKQIAKLIHAFHTDNAAILAKWYPVERVNKKNKRGQTPLFYACTLGSVHCVRWFLENGADANVSCADGSGTATPLYVAMHKAGSYECVELLLRIGRANISSIIMRAAIDGDKREMTRLLLSHGGSVSVLVWSPAPPWWMEILQSRERCRRAAVVLMGIRRMRRADVLETNGMDAIRLIAMRVWRTQLYEKWIK